MTALDAVDADRLDVTIAVVTYNSAAVVGELLASLARAGLDGVDRHEIVVVDNGSTDGTIDVVREVAPSARVIETGSNGGYAAGINLARRAARPSRAMLITNADVRFRSGSVARLLDALGRPGVGIAVAQEILPGGRRDSSLRREPSVLRTLCEAVIGGRWAARLGVGEAVVDEAAYTTGSTAAWASGAVHMVSQRCFDDTGPWDESFFLYSEETDFDLRARDRGYRLCYVPDAVIDHDCGDMRTSPWLWSLRSVNRVVLYRRRQGTVRGGLFWGAAVLNELLRSGRSPVHRAALRALLHYARTGSTGAPARTA
jgi:GT2 family glycosyltransferase